MPRGRRRGATAAAPTGEESDGGGLTGQQLTGAIVDALEQFLLGLFTPIRQFLEDHAGNVLLVVLETPAPTRVFATPTNPPWVEVYAYYWEGVVPAALLLFGLAAALVVLLEATSVLFSSYHRVQLKRRAAVAFLGILSWWWINAYALRLTDAVVTTLAPSLTDLSLFEVASFGAIGALGTVLALGTDFLLVALMALVYFLRHILLYFYTLAVPLLLAAWVPGVGPFRLVTALVRRAAGLYVPVLLMPVPVALLFRLGQVLGDSASLSLGGVGAWIAALVVPVVAVVAPLVLVWQAGRVGAVARLAARNVSRRQAVRRVGRAKQGGASLARRGARGVRGVGNAVRGSRGTVTAQPSGQQQSGAGGSLPRAVRRRRPSGGRRIQSLDTRHRGDESTDTDTNTNTNRYEPTEFRTDDGGEDR